jgi:hypothetical protein
MNDRPWNNPLTVSAHESPYLNKGNHDTLLRAGMTFTAEPGIYLENKFGVRHEDIYLVKVESVPFRPTSLEYNRPIFDVRRAGSNFNAPPHFTFVSYHNMKECRRTSLVEFNESQCSLSSCRRAKIRMGRAPMTSKQWKDGA